MITARNAHARFAIVGACHLFDLGCELASCEFSTALNGIPGDYVFDAVGLDFKRRQVRIVEAKTSRSDFLQDEYIHGEPGYTSVAHQCWLVCPDGLIDPQELPAGWGLLYFCENVTEVTYVDGNRRRRRRVRSEEAKAARAELAETWRRNRKTGQGCLVVRTPQRLKPGEPLSDYWDQMVRGVGRKLTRGALGIAYVQGKPVPQPIDCLEL